MWRFWRRKPPKVAVPTPPQRIYEVLYVYPGIEATPDDLIAPGRALRDWVEANDPSITDIVGLDELLAGQFPPEEVYIGCINPQTLAAPLWEKCPAILRSPDVDINNERVMEGLKRGLPPDLYRGVHWPPMD